MTTIEGISIEVARALIDQAAAANVSPDEYLKRLLGLANGHPRDVALSLAEFDAAMEEFGEDVTPSHAISRARIFTSPKTKCHSSSIRTFS